MPTNLKIVPRLSSFAAAGFVLLAVVNADAQSPVASSVADAQTAGPSFDGKYQAVSSAKVNQMFIAQKGNMGVCPDRMPGPLTIVHNQARYTDASGDEVDGTVGPQGELAMQAEEPGGARAMDLDVSGSIAANGTVRARQEGNSCSYDFVWQKDGQLTPSTAGHSLSIVSSPASRRAG